MTKWVKLGVGVLIGGVCLWYSLSKLDFRVAGEMLAKADLSWIALAVALLMSGYALRAYRWLVMLRGVGSASSYSVAYRIFLASVAMNNVLPFRAGDIARAISCKDDLEVSTSQILGTMIVERLLDLMSLLAIFFVALSGVPADRVPANYVALARGFLVAMVVALLGMLVLAKPIATRMEGKGRVFDAVASMLHSVHTFAPAKTLAILVGLSIPAWLLESGLFVATAQALHIPVVVGGPMFSMAISTLATMIPSTPGYVGTFDVAAAEGLKAYAAAPTQATVFALTAHVVLWVPLTAVGFGLLSLYSVRRAALAKA